MDMFMFILSLGLESQSTNGPAIVTDHTNACSLAKEIRLKHKAPVLSIVVLDGLNHSIGQGSNIPTSDFGYPDVGTCSEHTNTHKVLICSEEQFKVKQNFRVVSVQKSFRLLRRYSHYHS